MKDISRLVEENKGLVAYTIKTFKLYSQFEDTLFDNDDIYQAGLIGLYKACERFDDSKGCTLATFAVSYIHNYIRNGHRNTLGTSNKHKVEARNNTLSLDFVYDGGYNSIEAHDFLKDDMKTDDEYSVIDFICLMEKHLTREQQELVTLRYEGYTFKDIAAEKQIPKTTAKRKIEQACIILKEVALYA